MEMETSLLIAVRLSREGYGDPQTLLQTRSDIVLACLQHSEFTADYERAFAALNKETPP